MADFSLKSGDTWPPVDATLSDANGAINLTTATSVKFVMAPTGGGGPTVNSVCTITNAALGQVRYVWVSPNTDTSGTYKVEFEILWSDGKIGTVPNEGYLTVEILDDLN